jgi:hypothetical protein
MSNAMESCVGKSYREITEIFLNKHGWTPDNRKIDAKWRRIGSSL